MPGCIRIPLVVPTDTAGLGHPFPDRQIRVHPTIPADRRPYNCGMNHTIKKFDQTYFRVVSVQINGRREVRATNLYRPSAETVARSLSGSGRVVIERQRFIEPYVELALS
jgi:hypothetical protein